MVATSSASCLACPRPASLRRRDFSIGDRIALQSGRGRARIGVKLMASASDSVSKLHEAAKLAVDSYVKNGMMVGLGTGPASCMAIQYLGNLIKQGTLTNIVGIPMSVSSASEALEAGIPLDQYRDTLQIDFAFDDADVVEEGTLAAIIGRRKLEGGESLKEEKSVIRSAEKLAFIVDETQYTGAPEGSVPVLIKTGNWLETAEEIDDLFLGDAEVWRRPAIGYAGPSGGDSPLITKDGCYVLDLIFTSPILDLAQVGEQLDQIDGVVEHGIISGLPCTAVVAAEDGPRVVVNVPANAVNTTLSSQMSDAC
ncbi:nagB/RpiA/CoA transferase-like superfamily protein [Wolffia australiana]